MTVAVLCCHASQGLFLIMNRSLTCELLRPTRGFHGWILKMKSFESLPMFSTSCVLLSFTRTFSLRLLLDIPSLTSQLGKFSRPEAVLFTMRVCLNFENKIKTMFFRLLPLVCVATSNRAFPFYLASWTTASPMRTHKQLIYRGVHLARDMMENQLLCFRTRFKNFHGVFNKF